MLARIADVGPLNGPLIAGRYLLGEPLGSGGAAVVRRGWDTCEGRAVALKSPPVDGRKDAAVAGREMGSWSRGQRRPSRLTRSAGASSERDGSCPLSRTHISRGSTRMLKLRGGPGWRWSWWMGWTCGAPCASTARISTLAALDVGRQMCAALAAVHAAGVVHRDVKPQNVMLSHGGHATLIDFDLAWTPALRDDWEPNLVYGTPEYMAPEQAMGERITAATDIYALGVTLYELLAGSAPFHSSTASAIMWRHVTETPQPLREWRHDLPAPVERAVMRALAKEPRRRYPSAEAMARALAQAQDVARLAPTHRGVRFISLPTVAPHMAETLAPVPAVVCPAPTPAPPPPMPLGARAGPLAYAGLLGAGTDWPYADAGPLRDAIPAHAHLTSRRERRGGHEPRGAGIIPGWARRAARGSWEVSDADFLRYSSG